MKGNRKFLAGLAFLTAGFVILCGLLVWQTGLFKNSSSDNLTLLQNVSTQSPQAPQSASSDEKKTQEAKNQYWAVGSSPEKAVIGAADPNTEDPDRGFKLQLQLSCFGASIEKVTFSDGNNKGFNDRNPKNPRPLVLLSPMRSADGSTVLSMENQSLVLAEQGVQLALDKFAWKLLGVRSNGDGSQSATFQTEINYAEIEKILVLSKTYTVYPRNYLVDCNLSIENISIKDLKVSFALSGPVGIEREDKRADDRKTVGGFEDTKGVINAVFKPIANIKKAKTADDNKLTKNADEFLWAAIVNKYFAAIVVPVPDEGAKFCQWISGNNSAYYPEKTSGSGDENLGIGLNAGPAVVKSNNTRNFKFQIYFGPKDKGVFDSDKRFKDLGFVNAIEMPCCCMFCPIMAFIRPLAFGLITLMSWMFLVIPNYGVVIIILVFVVRLLMHPLTKKSQVSMSKFSKLQPKIEELKKKYGNDKVEMNKQMMALYKEQGASPFLGMLPMFIQMPIWVALYTAIDASISLRGAPFLPFWITDLSRPDAIFTFPDINLFLFSVSSVNLLPILMGVAFYIQQKLTPQQPATNPQMESTQKMMMWMMPLLFPVMLYSAPSGLNLYIGASTFAGAIEQYVIKKHIEQQKETESAGLVPVTSKTGGKVKKKKPKPFFKKYI